MAKILVAEDDRMLLKTIAFKLEKEGHDVFTAPDGRQALEIINEEKPELLISDIMMPYLNGLELINHIKSLSNQQMAIIMLTSNGQEDTVMKAFEMGVDDFVTKPFSLNELFIRVKKHLLVMHN